MTTPTPNSEACPSCKGTGYDKHNNPEKPWKWTTCGVCSGTGKNPSVCPHACIDGAFYDEDGNPSICQNPFHASQAPMPEYTDADIQANKAVGWFRDGDLVKQVRTISPRVVEVRGRYVATPMPVSEININQVLVAQQERERINSLGLYDATFVYDGKPVTIPHELLDDFMLLGLSNIDLITSSFLPDEVAVWHQTNNRD